MKKVSGWLGLACCVFALLTAGSVAEDGATCSLLAVKVNDAAITPTDNVVISPGDIVEIEFMISDWGQWIDQARIFQLNVDVVGYTSGDFGALVPVGWYGPYPPPRAWSPLYPEGWDGCDNDADCALVCALPEYEPVGGFLICDPPYDCMIGGKCRGEDHHPEDGLFLNQWRSDFIHDGFEPRTCQTQTATLSDYKIGCVVNERVGRVDNGESYYAGSLVLEAQGNACGEFTVGILTTTYPPIGPPLEKSFVGGTEYPVAINVPLISDPLTLTIPSEQCVACPRLSNPPSCVIDARQPNAADDSAEQYGWDAVDITFTKDPGSVLPVAFSVWTSRGFPPVINSVVGEGNTRTLELSKRISPKAWTCFEYIPAECDGWATCLGYLPGDINSDRETTPNDVTDLIDVLSGVVGPAELWQCDADRSGHCAPADILRVVDILNGGGDLASFLGASLPPIAACPAM